jgi:ribosomal protein L37E
MISNSAPREGPRRNSAGMRKSKLTCDSCGSSDLWRIAPQTGIVAAIMRYRGRKPVQCRKCGRITYHPPKREKDADF